MLVGFLRRKRKAGDSVWRASGQDLGRVGEETVIGTLYGKHLCSIKDIEKTHSEIFTVNSWLKETSI